MRFHSIQFDWLSARARARALNFDTYMNVCEVFNFF